MEPDYGADSGIWDDHLLRWGGYSEYLCGRYVQTSATSTRDFHLGPKWKAPISQKPITTLLYKPPAGRAEWLKATLSMRGLVPWAPQMAPAICQPPLLSWSQPATPYQQLVQPLSKTSGLGVTFDSSASKPAPTDSPDTDVCGRQATRG